MTLYGNVRAASRIKVLGRVDVVSPADELKSAPKYACDAYKLFIAGVDFDLGGGINFIPNLQMETGDRERKLLNLHLIVSF